MRRAQPQQLWASKLGEKNSRFPMPLQFEILIKLVNLSSFEQWLYSGVCVGGAWASFFCFWSRLGFLLPTTLHDQVIYPILTCHMQSLKDVLPDAFHQKSSCRSNIFFRRYSLACSQLSPGDVCISLAHADHQKNSLAEHQKNSLAEHQKNTLAHRTPEHQKNTSGIGSHQNRGPGLSTDGACSAKDQGVPIVGHNNSKKSTSFSPRLPPPLQPAKADT